MKAVPSPSEPAMDETLPVRHSTSCPMVMREGMACCGVCVCGVCVGGGSGSVGCWIGTAEERSCAPTRPQPPPQPHHIPYARTGLTMMSGVMPWCVHGMSSWRYVMPMVPFCPCRDENLSPICGTRTLRIRTVGLGVVGVGHLLVWWEGGKGGDDATIVCGRWWWWAPSFFSPLSVRNRHIMVRRTLAEAEALLIGRQHHAVHDARLLVPHARARVLLSC